ncbi:hypothetical protein CRI77_06385 [Mycolicibacterium duvalii]|uniref:Uncharacterized protein n=1 Tax=Mycolicibacterium duvalii TaxID=39688 RepID=A0A7I7K8A2_9MYCO|nr:hypothetical protein [Mycolicibacterium duvalii]MCV7368146.1 hypothetical protein [Mycolicibacterium duvalii]PEG43365.1 hypothetical protein CRI77_06385 [Mycolicibacterium duvalii]BBX19799.1 hypothetical protein MDUV_46590 [Mycolicibacterium duvalii]
MTTRSAARLALAAVLLCPIALISIGPVAAQPSPTPCAGDGRAVDPLTLMMGPDSLLDLPLQEPAPASSCEDRRKQCLSDAAQQGIYGERYVPVEAVQMCNEAYRACVNAPGVSGP